MSVFDMSLLNLGRRRSSLAPRSCSWSGSQQPARASIELVSRETSACRVTSSVDSHSALKVLKHASYVDYRIPHGGIVDHRKESHGAKK